MLTLGPLGFTAPWLLLGLIALPILWILLRAVPPAPIRRRFPGVALLLGLDDDESQTDRTPWWLLLLRMLAIAAVIIGFAGPVLNPDPREAGRGPLLVLVDGTWADASDWTARIDRVRAVLSEARRDDRTVALATTTDLPPEGPTFQAPGAWLPRLVNLRPQPWEPEQADLADWGAALTGDFDTFWLSDGLDRPGRQDLLLALEARGDVAVFQSPRSSLGLRPAEFVDGQVALDVIRATQGPGRDLTLAAFGLDPAGVERQLDRIELELPSGETSVEARLDLPPELRNRITRFELTGQRSAGAVSLTDDSLRRREVALIAGREDREGLELLSPLHYLEQALEPTADLIDGALSDALLANPHVVVLADVARLSDAEAEALTTWLEEGGLLLRFAGPRLAASDLSRETEDPLMPVRLRVGGRSVGGAMSWGEPKSLQPFPETSPFHGLAVPEEVVVSAQVLAQPDPTLADRTIASLADGTPLVTRKQVGDGHVVLFHVTANAEWSTLPLSGLFVQMLERLAVSTRTAMPDAEMLEGTVWQADEILNAYGELEPADTMPGIEGTELAAARPGPALPPGLYSGEDRRIAVNVIGAETALTAMVWPDRIPVEGLNVPRERDLKGVLLTLAMLLLAADVLAALFLSGKLGLRRMGGSASVLILALVVFSPEANAQDGPADGSDAPSSTSSVDDAFALAATSEVSLAYVITGNPQVDETARAGLDGLSTILYNRTSIEPAPPVGVDLEMDELAFFPFLYWPITTDQPIPSSDAYAKLNTYLRSGGMILFDTRDADIGSLGADTPNGGKLRQLARPLDIPPLETIPPDHVLTRTFYLLQDFPGRHTSLDVWVEAAPPDAEQIEGMPFRDLNDGVTPVVIGGNDWSAAWATDAQGRAMYPVGRGYYGDRQRELAYRFGVNLIMHVLTGNYKSDQVHVPALLDRLGQ